MEVDDQQVQLMVQSRSDLAQESVQLIAAFLVAPRHDFDEGDDPVPLDAADGNSILLAQTDGFLRCLGRIHPRRILGKGQGARDRTPSGEVTCITLLERQDIGLGSPYHLLARRVEPRGEKAGIQPVAELVDPGVEEVVEPAWSDRAPVVNRHASLRAKEAVNGLFYRAWRASSWIAIDSV